MGKDNVIVTIHDVNAESQRIANDIGNGKNPISKSNVVL